METNCLNWDLSRVWSESIDILRYANYSRKKLISWHLLTFLMQSSGHGGDRYDKLMASSRLISFSFFSFLKIKSDPGWNQVNLFQLELVCIQHSMKPNRMEGNWLTVSVHVKCNCWLKSSKNEVYYWITIWRF